MADNMRVSSDGLTYLFRLREGVRWSDGEPVTAEDFVFAWRSIREEQAITAFLLEDIESAEALDERTLEVRLREPRSYFPYILASSWAFPRPRHRCDELGEEWRKPENLVGNGPFVLDELSDDGALLVANPHWVGGRGNVKEFAIRFTGERLASTSGATARYDVLQVYDRRVEEAPDTSTTLVPELSMTYVGFRPDIPPFSNELVRKAFSHAVDREGLFGGADLLVRAASRGRRDPARDAGPLAPGRPGVRPRVRAPPPRRGRLPGGPRAAAASARDRRHRGRRARAHDLLVEQWEALGARIELNVVRRPPLVDRPDGRADVGERLDGRLPGPGRLLPRSLPGDRLAVLPRRRRSRTS